MPLFIAETCSFCLVHTLLFTQTSSCTLAHRLQPAHHSSLVLGLSSPEAVDLRSGEEYLSCCCLLPWRWSGLLFPPSNRSIVYRELPIQSSGFVLSPGFRILFLDLCWPLSVSMLTFVPVAHSLPPLPVSIPTCVSCLSAYISLTFSCGAMQSLWALW